MELVERTASTQNIVDVIATIGKDAARRSTGYKAVFDEIAKTLGLLSEHRLLKNDVQFLGLVDALTGIEDSNVFDDRVSELIAYVHRVAQAHGVATKPAASNTSNSIVMHQRPAGLADPDDDLSQRTRLQVR